MRGEERREEEERREGERRRGEKGEDMNCRFERDKEESRRTSVDQPPSLSLSLPLFTHQQEYGGPNKLLEYVDYTLI